MLKVIIIADWFVVFGGYLKVKHFRKTFYFLRVFWMLLLAFIFGGIGCDTILPGAAFAKEEKRVERDVDGDGKIDQIAFFDAKGKIARLEIDSNNDGLMDGFQYYKDEKPVRLETDTDFDRRIDCLN